MSCAKHIGRRRLLSTAGWQDSRGSALCADALGPTGPDELGLVCTVPSHAVETIPEQELQLKDTTCPV